MLRIEAFITFWSESRQRALNTTVKKVARIGSAIKPNPFEVTTEGLS